MEEKFIEIIAKELRGIRHAIENQNSILTESKNNNMKDNNALHLRLDMISSSIQDVSTNICESLDGMQTDHTSELTDINKTLDIFSSSVFEKNTQLIETSEGIHNAIDLLNKTIGDK